MNPISQEVIEELNSEFTQYFLKFAKDPLDNKTIKVILPVEEIFESFKLTEQFCNEVTNFLRRKGITVQWHAGRNKFFAYTINFQGRE